MPDASARRRTCGQLVIGGFEGGELPTSFAKALERGERGGAIFFARNLTDDPMRCAELARAVASHAPADLPPLVSIDQEGGRVARLKAPVLTVPPLRALARTGDAGLVRRVAQALARQLAALGVTMNFAPVLDVDTNPDNPIIGDRAFAADWVGVHRFGSAWIAGSLEGGVLPCGKHFPGHGDTTKDSHLDLPVCDAIEGRADDEHVRAFGATIRSTRLPAIMTAHVVYPRIDGALPATLSPTVLGLARDLLKFEGCIVSDDLEMKAIADRWSIEESATRAIAAGCDALLVCRSEELQDRAVDALARRASEDAAFDARVNEARDRFVAMRARVAPKPAATRSAFDEAGAMAHEVATELAAAMAVRS